MTSFFLYILILSIQKAHEKEKACLIKCCGNKDSRRTLSKTSYEDCFVFFSSGKDKIIHFLVHSDYVVMRVEKDVRFRSEYCTCSRPCGCVNQSRKCDDSAASMLTSRAISRRIHYNTLPCG